MTALDVTASTKTAAVVVGTRVRIERNEAQHPSKGTWPQFRGKTGTVVQVNVDRQRPHLTEHAVTFGKVRKPNQHGTIPVGPDTYWFRSHELVNAGSQRAQSATSTVPAIDDTREPASATEFAA